MICSILLLQLLYFQFLSHTLGLQLSHVGGDQPAPVSSVSVELLEPQTLHQLVEDPSRTHGIETCSHVHGVRSHTFHCFFAGQL